MVHLRKQAEMNPIRKVFDNSCNVKIFFFYFDNAAMSGKPDKSKTFEPLVFLNREALQFYFES